MNDIEPINQSKAEELMTWAISLQIVDQGTRQAATKLTLELRSGIKKIKAFYKDKKHNAKSAYDALVKEEKDFIKPYLDAQGIVDEKISNDYLERERRTAEQQENLRKLNTNNEEWSPDIVLPEAQRSLQVDGGSVNVRPKKKIEVIDKKVFIQWVAKSDWPLDFLTINVSYIEKEINEKNWTNIPGIKIYTGTVITGRGK